MTDFTEGDFVLVDYGEVPQLWHMLYLLFRVENQELVIATPDYDIYIEDISLHNLVFEGLRVMGPNRALPPGLGGAAVYGFAALTGAEMTDLRSEGARLGRAEQAARGLTAGAAPARAAGLPAGLLGAAVAAPVFRAAPVPALAAPAGALVAVGAPGGVVAQAAAVPVVPGTFPPPMGRLMPAGGGFVLDEPTREGRVGDPSWSPPAPRSWRTARSSPSTARWSRSATWQRARTWISTRSSATSTSARIPACCHRADSLKKVTFRSWPGTCVRTLTSGCPSEGLTQRPSWWTGRPVGRWEASWLVTTAVC